MYSVTLDFYHLFPDKSRNWTVSSPKNCFKFTFFFFRKFPIVESLKGLTNPLLNRFFSITHFEYRYCVFFAFLKNIDLQAMDPSIAHPYQTNRNFSEPYPNWLPFFLFPPTCKIHPLIKTKTYCCLNATRTSLSTWGRVAKVANQIKWVEVHIHVTFSNWKWNCPAVTLNDFWIPEKPEAKYLGMFWTDASLGKKIYSPSARNWEWSLSSYAG